MRFLKSSTHPAWHIWPVCPAVSMVTWGRSVISAKDAASKHLQMSFTLCMLWKWACSSFMLLFIHLLGIGKVKWNRQKFWTAVGCVFVLLHVHDYDLFPKWVIVNTDFWECMCELECACLLCNFSLISHWNDSEYHPTQALYEPQSLDQFISFSFSMFNF